MITDYSQQGDFLKSRVENVGLTGRIIDALIKQNIRTVGGIVNRSREELARLLNLSMSDVNLVLEKTESLKQSVKPEQKTTSPVIPIIPDLSGDNDIIETLSNYFGQEKDDIESHSRRQDLVRTRDYIIYLLRKYGDMSFPAIGKLLGDRDHTTIIHSYQKINENIIEHPELESELANLIGRVQEIKDRKFHIEKELIPEILTSTRTEASSFGRTSAIKEISERNMKILGLWREGLTLENIGKVIGVSRERIRQVVISTVKQIAVNESISKGIVMDSEVLAEEESRKRKRAQDAKRIIPSQHQPKEKRWSRYYAACRSCGTTTIPHVRKGLCEQCVGQFRGERREDIVNRHDNKCDSCGRTRYEATSSFGRDFYITKDKKVLCKECFRKYSGKILGSYKNYEWSRHHDKCLKCGTTSVPHAKKGLCENCVDTFTNKQRQRIIAEHGNKCDRCGIDKVNAKNKYGRDLYTVRSGEVLCKNCFQKRNMRKARENKREAVS